MVSRKDVMKAYWELPKDSREKIWIENGVGYNPKRMRVEKIHEFGEEDRRRFIERSRRKIDSGEV